MAKVKKKRSRSNTSDSTIELEPALKKQAVIDIEEGCENSSEIEKSTNDASVYIEFIRVNTA